MDQSDSRRPFTLRRTFTIGPALQRSAAPAVKPPPSQSCPHRTHLQRTRSAPVFTRRPVTSINKAHAAAAFRDGAVQAPLPPCPSPQIRRWKGQAFAEQPIVGKHTRIATHRFASAQNSFHISRRETPSTSPDPRAPLVTASAQLHSLASSIHSGGAGAAADASFSSKWYPAWAASPPSLQEEVARQTPPSPPDAPAPSRVATNLFHVLEKSAHAVPLSDIAGRSGAQLQRATHLCTAGSAAAADCLSTTQRTPTRRCGAAGDVSSLFPASLGHTMPPPKRTKSRRSTQSTTHGGPCVSEVCVRVESCTGLPRAPFSAEGEGEECVGDSQPVRSGETATTRSGNAVYVYMKSSHGGVRYKSPSLPYAVAVDFTHHLHDFYVPLHGENEAEEDEVLTFTVAVRFSSGKQVKLGVGRLAVCNLYEGESTCIPMPIVAKAGTVRARERGVLTVSLRVRGKSWLPRNGPHSPLDEAVVRSRVWAVMRRACRAQLDQAEVYVRRHCRDSAVELQRFLQRMECGTLLPQKTENVAVPVGSNDTVMEEKTRLCRVRHSATSAPSAGRQSSSSVFTSCVLDDVHGVRSTASCPRSAQKDEDARQHRRCSPRRSATVGCGREESHKQPLSKTKIKTAETSVPAASQKLPKQAQDANEAAELLVRVTVRSVRNLRDEHGLPRHDCASCFVRALVVDDFVCDHKTGVKSSAAPLTEFATETAAYGDDGAVFDGEGILLAVPAHLAQPVLRCSVLCGSKALHLGLGSCNVSLKSLLGSDGWMSERAGTYVLVHDAGSPLGYPCGELKLSLQRVAESDRSSCALWPETHTTQKETSMVLARRAAVERRVLSYLWHNRRNELHRLDNFVEDACAVGFDNAVARHWAPGKGPTSPSPPRVSRNAVRVTIYAAVLGHQKENSGCGYSPTQPTDARVPRLNFSGVYIAWSCGCFAGRVNIGDCVDALPSTIHLGEKLPLLEDVDVYRDELCFAFYGTAIAPSVIAGNATLCPVELCRAHVSLRSFPACSARRPAEVVQLPLVWHAGERGAYEGGYLSVAVNVAVNDSSSSSASDVKSTAASSEFRTAPWKGFQIDWPPRVAVVQLLRCYATDQLHRLLPLLADAEGTEEALVHRLQATYGTTATPVELRICLVGFRCHCPDYQACCLKVHHRDVNLLRTPTFLCSPPTHAVLALLPPNNCDREKACTVPLLDEDKYLFRVSTTAPQRERVVIKMVVEHLLRHSDVVASAELSLAAFVSLESRLAASLHQPSSTRHTFSSPRSPMWVPLCSSSGEIVGEVAVRVEWQHRTFLAPVRRVTTHKKSSVAAVLRTSQTEGRGRGSGTGNESLPLYDAHTMRDISSLVSAYAVRDLCRLTSYLSRWADATKAHARLRSQLLSSLHAATVYVDVAGLAPSMQDGGRASGGARGGELFVSALCLGASSPRPVVCPLLPADAARASQQAAAVFRAIDRAAEGIDFTSHQATLRLDLQLPTVDGVDADLNLVFLSSSSSIPSTTAVSAVSSSLPSQRALSAPRCSRGKTSSKLLHQLRSRSAAVAAALLPTAKQKASVTPSNHATRPASQTAEIGRVALSLRALLTTPHVYHDGDMVTVPVVHLVDSRAGDDTTQRTTSRSVVVGNVYLRVRTPAHEPPPAWLRFSDAEVQRINQCGRLTRKDVQSRLCERLRREAEKVKPDAHAAFFRTCAGSPEQQCTRRAQTAHCGAEGRRQRVLAPPRPPPVPPQPRPLHSTFATPAVPREDSFHVQAVRTRSQGSAHGAASVAELDDFSTPRKDGGAAAPHEWSSEQGGVTVERGSAAAKSTCQKDSTSSSSSSLLRVQHVSAQRVLFA